MLVPNWIVYNRTLNMYKDGFIIKWPLMDDIPLKQTKLKQNQKYC